LKKKSKIIDYLLNTKNPYQIKVGNMVVNIEYSKNYKKFNECILNILKQKIGK